MTLAVATRLSFAKNIAIRKRFLPMGINTLLNPRPEERRQRIGPLDVCPYSTQQNLPRMPVPPLSQTLQKFLMSVKPLLKPDKYRLACELVENFKRPGEAGEKLQRLLEERAKNTVNWLEEWWLNIAYLEYRLPVPIHVNPGILTPALPFQGLDQQLRYAARFTAYVLEYKKKIDESALPVDKLGNNELCMKQFYRIFGCCRVPGAKRDEVSINPGDQPDSPKHITVIRNNHIFSVDAYTADGRPLTAGQFYRQLAKIVLLSDEPTLPIGILTTDHRDNWYKAYARLVQDETNRRSLDNIHRSIFVLNLDKSGLEGNQGTDRDTIFLNQMEHGGGSRLNSGNRWFDKIFQAIVTPDGLIGFNYEHSAAEGPPILHLIDYCYPRLKQDEKLLEDSVMLVAPEKLKFNIDSDTEKAIASASKSFDDLIGDLDLRYYAFKHFGKDALKKLKASPDAFIQVAFQLAYYRFHGQPVPTYESGSLRKFQHGRTDTIRSCSLASAAYCQAMTQNKPFQEKADHLRSALAAHRAYTDQVINGQGIDRHLLGLKLIALENKLEVPQLLKDEVYEGTTAWKISTSQVPSKHGGLLCFGPVVPDGYGICYNPMDDRLLFAISRWRSSPETDAVKFSTYLEQCLNDGRALLELGSGSKL